MAKEAYSKVYITSEVNALRIVHPIVTPYPAFVRDGLARDIWKMADYRAKGIQVFERLPDDTTGKLWQSYWLVLDLWTKDKFRIDRMDWSWDEWYLKLLLSLEERKGSTDLTIIVDHP